MHIDSVCTVVKKLVIASSALLYLSALSGCMTGFALVTSPHIATLEKSADRYMVMETDVEIEGALRKIEVDWRCFQSPSFSANAGWYMRWQSDPQIGFVAKALPSGKYLVMGVGGIHCSNLSSPEFDHGQNVGILDADFSTLEILSNKEYGKARDERIRRSIIRVTSAPGEISRSPDELDVAEKFLSDSPSYATIPVNVWEADVWGRDPSATARVKPIDSLAFASDLHYPTSINGGGFGSFANRDGLLPGFTTLPIVNGKLDLNGNELIRPGKRIFGRTPGRGRNFENFEVCYKGECRKLKIGSGGGDQIYDPETKRVIQIGWPITSIGRNLNQFLE